MSADFWLINKLTNKAAHLKEKKVGAMRKKPCLTTKIQPNLKERENETVLLVRKLNDIARASRP